MEIWLIEQFNWGRYLDNSKSYNLNHVYISAFLGLCFSGIAFSSFSPCTICLNHCNLTNQPLKYFELSLFQALALLSFCVVRPPHFVTYNQDLCCSFKFIINYLLLSTLSSHVIWYTCRSSCFRREATTYIVINLILEILLISDPLLMSPALNTNQTILCAWYQPISITR